jgi:outer membrane protein OmpA-like peptidoglycan-associated protein
MSDVLFDTGQYTLKPGAREKLAKVAGILIAYPGLNIEVGGYTDNVGGDAMNQTLSENRAGAVRSITWWKQGVTTNSVSAKGYGNTLPVASNDNAAGRQENRRVELVVSGDAIGSPAMRRREVCANNRVTAAASKRGRSAFSAILAANGKAKE